jgi:hypothetical protein
MIKYKDDGKLRVVRVPECITRITKLIFLIKIAIEFGIIYLGFRVWIRVIQVRVMCILPRLI